MTLPKFIITMDGYFRLGMCKFGEPQQIVINLILSSKRAKSI